MATSEEIFELSLGCDRLFEASEGDFESDRDLDTELDFELDFEEELRLGEVLLLLLLLLDPELDRELLEDDGLLLVTVLTVENPSRYLCCQTSRAEPGWRGGTV